MVKPLIPNLSPRFPRNGGGQTASDSNDPNKNGIVTYLRNDNSRGPKTESFEQKPPVGSMTEGQDSKPFDLISAKAIDEGYALKKENPEVDYIDFQSKGVNQEAFVQDLVDPVLQVLENQDKSIRLILNWFYILVYGPLGLLILTKFQNYRFFIFLETFQNTNLSEVFLDGFKEFEKQPIISQVTKSSEDLSVQKDSLRTLKGYPDCDIEYLSDDVEDALPPWTRRRR